MLFFDNEHGNIRDVSQLGVTCVHTPGGMRDDAFFLQGLKTFTDKVRGGKK